MVLFYMSINEKLKISLMSLLVICGLAVYVGIFYPGYLTADTVYMLYQTNGMAEFSNWHPAFATHFLGFLYDFFGETGPIWLIQVILLIFSVALVSFRINSVAVSTLLFACLIFYPPVITNFGALWKDCFAIIWSLFTLYFSWRFQSSRKLLDISLVIIFALLASLTRTDYLIIVLPFVLSCAFLFVEGNRDCEDGNCTTLRKQVKISFLVFGLFFVSFSFLSNFFGSSVTKALNPWITIAIWDIGGVDVYSGGNKYVNTYNCRTSDQLVWGGAAPKINLPEGQVLVDVKIEAKNYMDNWKSAIVYSPVSYIKHRLCVAKTFLGFGAVTYPYPPPVALDNVFSSGFRRSPMNLDLYWFFDSQYNQFLYKYWIYLAITISLFAMSFIRRTPSAIEFAIFASVIFSCARVLVLPATDFRYGMWILVGSLVIYAMYLDAIVVKLNRFFKK